MRFLITGCNGFVGKHLTKFLKELNKEVYGFDIGIKENKNETKFFNINITNKNKVQDIIKKISPNIIIHLAALSSVKNSFDKKDITLKVNVDGTKNILDSIIEHNKNIKLLMIGSSEEYGTPKSLPVQENHTLNPISPYGKSKLLAEQLCKEYIKKGLNIIITRSFNHTGAGQKETFVCSNFAKQIAEIETGKKKPIINTGNLDITRDFTDVKDIIEAYYILSQEGKSGETYNICSGKEITIRQILNTLLSFSEQKIKIIENKSKRGNDIPQMIGDNTKIKQLGWTTKIQINTTLKNLLEYWQNIESK